MLKILNIISPISIGWSTAALLERAGRDLDTKIFYYIPGEGALPLLGPGRRKKAITLVLKGNGLSDRYLQKLPRPLVCWNFDFEREPDYQFIKASYDLYLTICPYFVTQLNMRWLPQGTDPTVFFPVKQKKFWDISFIGSPKPPRRKIIHFLREKFPFLKIKIWGEDWNDTLIKPAYYENFNIAVAQSKICLAINRYDNIPCYESTFSQRLYMLAACGAIILAENIPGLDKFFKTDSLEEAEMLSWENLEELTVIIQTMTQYAHDEAIKALGKRARRRAIEDHTYKHRLGTLLKWAEEL